MRLTPRLIPTAEGPLWVPLTDDWRLHLDSLRWARHLRFSKNRALSGVKTYAEGVALLLNWMEDRHFFDDYFAAARDLDDFARFLNTDVIRDGSRNAGQTRGAVRKSALMDGVYNFFLYLVGNGQLDESVLRLLYEPSVGRRYEDLDRAPASALRRRYTFKRTSDADGPPSLSADDFTALLAACRNVRDLFLLVLLRSCGLRIGEAAGLQLKHMHMASARFPGCRYKQARPHVHVVRNENNVNGAVSKTRKSRTLPIGAPGYNTYNRYCDERVRVLGTADNSPFVFVTLYQEPSGQPFTPRSLGRVVTRIGDRAGIDVHAHLLRHTFASVAANEDDVHLEVVQEMLGHESLSSTGIYVHPDYQAMHSAVDAAGSDFNDFLDS